MNNNVNAFKSFFIIYEKYIKTSFEQNVDLVIIIRLLINNLISIIKYIFNKFKVEKIC